MKDTDAFNVKFVQVIESYPVLYNPSVEGYTHRQTVEDTWNEVGKEFNETGTACKEKWTNLRCCYSRSLNQGYGKSKYYLADYLKFLKPFLKRKKTNNSSFLENTSLPQCKESDESIDDEDHYLESEAHEEDMHEFGEVEEPTPRIKSCGIKRKNERDPLEEPMMEYSNAKKRLEMNAQQDDADLFFLKSILPDLRRMQNAQKHEFKLKTMQTIGEILYWPPQSMESSSSQIEHRDI